MNLKSTHPQKYCLRAMCKALYYLGMGEFWYEETERSKYRLVLYSIWVAVTNAVNFLLVINEVLACVRPDVNLDKTNKYAQFTIAYVSVYLKCVVMQLYKGKIKKMVEVLVESNRSVYASFHQDKASVVQSMRFCVPLLIAMLMNFSMAVFNAIRIHVKTGEPIRTLATLYPHSQQNGVLTAVLQIIIELHGWYLGAALVTIDCLSFCCLVFTQYKFRIVRLHFLKLREDFSEANSMSGNEYENGFVIGIKLHEDALWCARSIQKTLGRVFDVQIGQSMTIIAISLIVVVSSKNSIILLLSSLFSLVCVLFLLGTYMLASGDITHEASLVPMTVFHSGWELTKARVGLRTLALVALQRAQHPVDMKAFGMITLSYESFISVLQTSYSFFALMY